MVSGFLSLDRGLPLVTVPHPDGMRTYLAVTANFDPTNSSIPRIQIPVGIATTTPGTEIPVTSYTVPAGKQHFITSAILACRTEGVARVYINDVLRAVKKTGAAYPNADFIFSASEIAAPGDTVEITFEARLNSAANSVESNVYGYEMPV